MEAKTKLWLKENLTDGEKSALSVLLPLGALTVDMAEAIRRGNAEEIVYCTEEAVLLRHACGICMLWAKSAGAGELALAALNGGDEYLGMSCCVAHGPAAKDAIAVLTKLYVEPPCVQFCRYSKEKLPLRNESSVRALELDDLDIVNATYKLGDPEHNRERIENGLMFGLEVDGELAAFMGFHMDGSTGMLEVLPRFRRRGLGTELENFMHDLHIDRGWVPYGHVYTDNEASLAMQRKIGLECASELIYWTYRTDIKW